MHAFLPRPYLMPVRDEEAESQRKAKSRHARQTRRSTQGVTLTDLKRAEKINTVSPGDGWRDDRASQDVSFCTRKVLTDDRRVKFDLTECSESSDYTSGWGEMDEQGNMKSSVSGLDSANNNSLGGGGRWGTDERRNTDETAGVVTFDPSHEHTQEKKEMSSYYSRSKDLTRTRKSVTDSPPSSPSQTDRSYRHDRLSRYDSGGESLTDKPLGRTSSYTRREARLGSVTRPEQESTTKDYKKMYAEALHENERLKSRLQDSKQELVRIRSQLERVTQRQERIAERSGLDSEKREKQALEKRVSGMEEELKILTELKSDNQRLKDENCALIRVISKLSK